MSDTAYYYPAPFWTLQETGWIKSLLLFFDDIATLLPDYMYGRHVPADPALAAPLEDRGLLHVLEPKGWLDQETTACLADIIVEMLTHNKKGVGDEWHLLKLLGVAIPLDLGFGNLARLRQQRHGFR